MRVHPCYKASTGEDLNQPTYTVDCPTMLQDPQNSLVAIEEANRHPELGSGPWNWRILSHTQNRARHDRKLNHTLFPESCASKKYVYDLAEYAWEAVGEFDLERVVRHRSAWLYDNNLSIRWSFSPYLQSHLFRGLSNSGMVTRLLICPSVAAELNHPLLQSAHLFRFVWSCCWGIRGSQGMMAAKVWTPGM